MKTLWVKKSAYAAALFVAAASGSLMAISAEAKAQSLPVAATTAMQTKPSVTLNSVAMIERKVIDVNGNETVTYKSPNEVQVVPGDKVVFKLSYVNKGMEPAAAFRATNPMPAPIQFLSVREKWAELSVDGGATWGQLDNLTVTETVKNEPAIEGANEEDAEKVTTKTVTRGADVADVTHVRWVFTKDIAPGARGDISYVGLIK